MRPLSATEAVSPAIARTKLILFSPFRLGRTWKLSATGYVSVYGSYFFPLLLLVFLFLPEIHKAGPRWVVWVVGTSAVVLTGLSLWIFLLTSRLQFVFFDLVLTRGQFVAPAWRKYAEASRPWTRMKGWVGTAYTVLLGLPVALWFKHTMHASHNTDAPGSVGDVFGFMACVMALYGGTLLLVLFGSLVNDFMVPSLALEQTSLAEAWRRTQMLARTEPGQVALYALLKVVLGMAAQMGGAILVEIFFLCFVLIAMAVGALIGWLLQKAGVPASFLQLAVIPVAVFGWFTFAFYCMPLVYGLSITFLESYRLYFLGGRYPLLGEQLDRTTPPPPNYGYPSATLYPPAPQPTQWQTAVYPPPAPAELTPEPEPPLTNPPGVDTTE